MAVPHSWLKSAIITHNKPKPQNSIIGILRDNVGGYRPNRSRDVVHASNITKPDFCPRQWALDDLDKVQAPNEFVNLALGTTFDMGHLAAKLIVEDWAGQKAIGNWVCIRCGDQRTMVPKPSGPCPVPPVAGSKDWGHLWRYVEVTSQDPHYGISGSLDCIFDVGTKLLMIAELKTMAVEEFAGIAAPLPEHRLRTALYLKMFAEGNFPYKDRLNLHEARVLYFSRGYGKMNAQWGEILPFKEYEVQRDDDSIKPYLQRARALQIFRSEGKMPTGICGTATDKYALKCKQCTNCFSGQHPAVIKIEAL